MCASSRHFPATLIAVPSLPTSLVAPYSLTQTYSVSIVEITTAHTAATASTSARHSRVIAKPQNLVLILAQVHGNVLFEPLEFLCVCM